MELLALLKPKCGGGYKTWLKATPTQNITTGFVVILIMPKDKGGIAVKS